MKKPELLAPAGDYERMKWAFWYGADAVYIAGKKFGLRANAPNFTMAEIKRAVSYAHRRHKKVYVTVNVVLREGEISRVINYVKKLAKAKVDAIIISDLAILQMLRGQVQIPIFISTQTSTMNSAAINFLDKLGVQRIILGREVSQENLKKIRQIVNLELEVFIHGAMCAGISGRCVLSNYLTNRDANRGGCSQVCRWYFSLANQQQIIDHHFNFAVKDLIMLEHIKELMKIGVDSFKIEGRMRSIYYLATVISIYRRVIDGYYRDPNYRISEQDYLNLARVANRPAVAQFFNNDCQISYHYYSTSMTEANQDFIGVVLAYKKNYALIEQRNYFQKGDVVEIFNANKSITWQIDEIYDEDMNEITVVRHPKQKVYLKMRQPVSQNDLIRKII